MLVVGLLVAAAGVAGVGLGARASRTPVVPCDDVILQARSGHADGYRVVLGIVSVPPVYLPQVVRSTSRSWPFWRKAGLAVRASHMPVTVSVPRAWRRRVAITWGNETPIVSSLRIAACPSTPATWNAYAGGFGLRVRAACVPLVFKVGSRVATVRFGVGRRCG